MKEITQVEITQVKITQGENERVVVGYYINTTLFTHFRIKMHFMYPADHQSISPYLGNDYCFDGLKEL